MPNNEGTGPRGMGRPGRGLGAPGFPRGQAHRNRHGQDQQESINPYAGTDQEYIYEYTLAELRERKQALIKEIQWLEDRIKELEEAK